jgi:hypothetical protein
MLSSLKAAATVVALASTTTLAQKAPNCNDNTNPSQIRLAYAGHGGMAVSWNTKQKLSNPTVYFGREISKLNRFASSDISTTYLTSTTYNNHVTLQGLEPDTTYYYMPQCGDQAYSFTTALGAGSGKEFSFAMVGDLGTMGPLGLSNTSAGAHLNTGEPTTIDSLQSDKSNYEFVWHGLSPFLDVVFVSSADFPQLATLPTPIPGSRKRKQDTSHQPTCTITVLSMIKSSMHFTTKLPKFLKIVPIWLALVSFLIDAQSAYVG